MPELESLIEQKLIEQLIYGDSQWTYRPDLKTEADLWSNFKYILEQNNKDRLDGEPLSDSEFEQVKNQLQFSTFYKAGEWLVGENGKVMVHVQRDTKKLHLVVMNHEHIAGGSSVYEVINQYSALKDDDDAASRDRRFDVTLMINGLPMIHIELKNRQHSYMEAFNQIKKYIGEGQFRGIFSAVQMFVISNGVDTKYFSAASDTELKKEFISGWVDRNNQPVSDYIDFAKNVLKIPQAHEMIARYTVLDNEAKRLILLRPYQIHAIEAIREASRTGKSLWFGFTGTPRFPENPYPLMGDLPRTTEELYGACLHKYTIQNAIHDNAVLGFQVEHDGPKDVTDETDSSRYENETHMLKVLEVILNKSYHKLGFQNGKGKTFEGLLTTSSISLAQKYYELLTRVKNGETPLKIDERIKQVLPDFPKFAITYSVTENEDGSQVNQEKMKQSLDDYNAMFDTKFDISQITSYNSNLNKRLSRKDPKYKSRNEQLDLVIVVDRLLTGFDAPCMSTIFIDRQPMGPHDLIQAFSRTNRIFDKKSKPYGQIVTFQAPVLFKKCVDDAVKLYSAGSTEDTPLIAEWDDVEPAFKKALAALRIAARTPDVIPSMSDEEKLHFMKMFQSFDRLFAQLKSFSRYDESMLDDYGITEQEYIDYAGHYLNIKSEIGPEPGPDPVNPRVELEIDSDYELMAYSNTRIDYEYIINLIQNIVNPEEDGDITPEEKQKKIDEAKQYVEDLRKDNPKVADIMSHLINEIELDESRFKGKSILNIVENMKHECIEQVVSNFCLLWHADKDDVMYAATHYRNGVIPNESAIKASIDYPEYKNTVEHALPKFKYYAKFFAELRSTLDDEIKPLV